MTKTVAASKNKPETSDKVAQATKAGTRAGKTVRKNVDTAAVHTKRGVVVAVGIATLATCVALGAARGFFRGIRG